MLPFSIQLTDGTPASDQILLAVRKALLTGQIPNLPFSKFDKFNSPIFRGRRWKWVDPLKDITATIMAINNGLSSWTEEINAGGGDSASTSGRSRCSDAGSRVRCGGGGAFAVANLGPDAANLPVRTLVETLSTPNLDAQVAALEQQTLKLGRIGDTLYEVLEGLESGDHVVISGNMLIDSQAQLDHGLAAPKMEMKP